MTMRMLPLALLLIPTAGLTADPPSVSSYEECMGLARRQPAAAFEAAVGWSAMGGGEPADHCAAYALNAAGQHVEAARRFEVLAQTMRAEPPVRATVFAQGAQASLLAGDVGRAVGLLDAAIRLDGRNPELYIDRAEAHAARKDYQAALADLDRALSHDPDNVDALVFRASALRMMNDPAGARRDIERALALDPGHPEALLERGILRRLAEDAQGARADWMRILTEAPDSAAARDAQRNLELMDVGGIRR